MEDTSSEHYRTAAAPGAGSPSPDDGPRESGPDHTSAPPPDGYRVFEDAKVKDKDAALPTIMHNFTHRIKHQASGNGSRVVGAGAAGWEGGSRLSFDGLREGGGAGRGGGRRAR